MCGRTAITPQALANWKFFSSLPNSSRERLGNFIPSWNVKPTNDMPIIFTDHKVGETIGDFAYWSLVPIWAKSLKSRFPTFNARVETAAEKPTFRTAVKHSRCIVPVSNFYEWTGPRGDRTPHAIFGPEEVLPLAGLFSWWHEPDAGDNDGWHLTATILTRSSAGVMTPIHDRMPVFLDENLFEEWLDPSNEGDQSMLDAISEASLPISETLHEWVVRSLKGDGPELVEPA